MNCPENDSTCDKNDESGEKILHGIILIVFALLGTHFSQKICKLLAVKDMMNKTYEIRTAPGLCGFFVCRLPESL